MSDKKNKDDPAARPSAAETAREIVLEPAGEVVTTAEELAAKAPSGKQIHPRRPLPLVPEARPAPVPAEHADPGETTPRRS